MLKIFECQAAEAAWIHEAELKTAGEGEAGVGVGGEGGGRIGHQQAASHAQMDDPLRVGLLAWIWSFCRPAARRRAKFADDVLAGAVNGEETTAEETASLLIGWGLERFRMGTEPGVEDAKTANPPINSAGHGFHLGKLGHRSIIAGERAPVSERRSERLRGYCRESGRMPRAWRMRLASKLTIFHLPRGLRT